MAKERPRKKSRSTADDYLFLPQADEKQKWGRGREREGEKEKEKERDSKRKEPPSNL